MNGNDRSIVGFVTISHGMVHTYELSIPILMTIWLVEFPVTAATLGTVVAAGYALMGVGALPGGVLVDAYSSRTIIVGCLLGMGASFLLLSLAPNVLTITAALCLWGAAASVYHPAGLSLLSKGVTGAQGRAFAYHGMGGNAGIAFGPLVAVVLLIAFDWRAVAAIMAVPAIATALYGLRQGFDETAAVDEDATVKADGAGSGSGLSGFIADSRTLFTLGFSLVFLVVMFNGLYYRGMLTFLPDVLGDFLAAAVGENPLADFGALGEEFDLAKYLYSGLLMIGIVGQYVGGRLTDRFPPEYGLAAVLALLAVVAVAFVPAASLGLGPLLAASAVLGFTLFVIQPMSQKTVANYSAPEVRGLSYGFTYLAIFGIGALGASMAGIVLTYASVEAMYLVLAGVAATGSAVAVVLIAVVR